MNPSRPIVRAALAMFAMSCGGRTGLVSMVSPTSSWSDAGVARDSGPGDPRADAGADVGPDSGPGDPRADAAEDTGRDSDPVGYALTVTTTIGPGAVTSSPAGIDCGSTCTATFAANTVVTLTAKPDATSWFAGWHGACTGMGACVVTMDAAKSVEAQFYPILYGLNVSTLGAGTVTSSMAGFTCGGNSTCSVPVLAHTVVTLTARPDATSFFAGWSGACTGMDACVVTMSTNQSVTARFGFP